MAGLLSVVLVNRTVSLSAQERFSADVCMVRLGAGLLVTEDSIGPLPARAPMRELKRMCPSATPTVRLGDESASPALQFILGRDTALASQSTDRLLDDRPPDLWVVSGPDVKLMMGKSLRSRWGELREAYGRAMWSAAISKVLMSFCNYPDLAFEINMPFDGEPVRPETVPDDATINAVWVTPGFGERCR